MSKQKSTAAVADSSKFAGVAEPEAKERPALLAEVVTLDPKYTDVYHITRTLGPFTDGDAVWSSEKATEKLMEKFAEGYDLLDVETMGAWPQGGVYVLWLLGKPVGVPREVSEIHHVVRTVSGLGSQGSITGFQADGYITSYIKDGWRLFRDRVIPLGMSPAGVTLFWVLVR